MAEGTRARSGYNFAEYFGDGRLLTQLQVLPEQQTWHARPPKQPGHVPVVLYLGCNVLRTGHLVQTVQDMLTRVAEATGLTFEATGGPAYCCGIVHHREGETEMAAQMSARTLSYFEQFSPERVVMWCPSCIYFYDEVVQAKTPYRVQHVSEYLLEHRDVFGELAPVPGKVTLHYHDDSPARLRERDAVRALLGSVPGLELLDPGCEPGWGRSCTWPATESAQEVWRSRAACQLQTAVNQSADTLATMYHGCQRLLCGYESDYPLTIEHYLTVFGRAAGVEYPDTYKRYLSMADPDAILADAAPCIRAHGIDESRARDVVTRHFATGKGV
jgi:heterodisulfide reductase subunit D